MLFEFIFYLLFILDFHGLLIFFMLILFFILLDLLMYIFVLIYLISLVLPILCNVLFIILIYRLVFGFRTGEMYSLFRLSMNNSSIVFETLCSLSIQSLLLCSLNHQVDYYIIRSSHLSSPLSKLTQHNNSPIYPTKSQNSELKTDV